MVQVNDQSIRARAIQSIREGFPDDYGAVIGLLDDGSGDIATVGVVVPTTDITLHLSISDFVLPYIDNDQVPEVSVAVVDPETDDLYQSFPLLERGKPTVWLHEICRSLT